MRYNRFTYLYPPRPDQAISPSMLPTLENQGYRAQYKKNGTCNVIAVSPEGEVICRSRHADEHKAWSPDPKKLTAFSRLAGRGWYVFVAELLNNKVKGLRDINYVHDILVHNGEYLVGRTQAERRSLLRATFDFSTLEEAYSHNIYDEHTWIARQFDNGFSTLFEGMTEDQDEGLVLKMPTEKLALCVREKSNNAGMMKIRRTTKKYTF